MLRTGSVHPAQAAPARLLITAGPTHEPIDGVRFLGNRSSGRLGVSLAAAAARRGHPTTLLLGPTCLPPPDLTPPDTTGLAVVRFRTTHELEQALADLWPAHDVLLMAAAVADYRPARPLDGKIRRGERLTLDLEATPDLVAALAAASRPDQTVIGFALEPAERLASSARDKLARKGLHAIVANPLETMDAETITATLVRSSGESEAAPPDITKSAFAEWLLDRVPKLHARH